MSELTPHLMDAKELSAFYRFRFAEDVKNNFLSRPFDQVWPPITAEIKKDYDISGWRIIAISSLRDAAENLMNGHSIGREEAATGCFFLAAELLAHPEFTKDDFVTTMDKWTKESAYHFPDRIRCFVLDNLKIAYNITNNYVSKNISAYDDSVEDLKALIFKSTAIDSMMLTADQKAIESFSKEVFGLNVKFFKGLDELHGRYDSYTNAIYVNADTPADIDWAFWHVAFHSMKELDPRLYDDLLLATKKAKLFSREDIVRYRLDIKQPHMSEEAVLEEMLADAFADLKTNRRPVIQLAEKRTGAAARLMHYAKSAAFCVGKVLFPEDQEDILPYQSYTKYPAVALTDEQFSAFADQLDRIAHQVIALDLPKSFTSTAYRIVSSDERYLGAKLLLENARIYAPDLYHDFYLRKFDMDFVREANTTPQLIIKALQSNSPLAVKASYGKNLVNDVGLSKIAYAR